MKPLISAALLLLLSGCMDSTRLVKDGQATAIPQHSSFYVAQSEDGFYGARLYPGSGKITSTLIKSALQKNRQKAVMANRVEDFDQALLAARQGGYAYLVFPTIVHWEDRATEWNFLRDKVQVRIDLVDVFTGQPDSSVLIEGKSGIATLGGDHPQDLLPDPINEYFQSALGVPPR